MESKFIVIEGLEGSGKTTAIDTVVNTLHDQGIHDIIFTREPGGTPIAEKLRDLFKKGYEHDLPTINTEVLILYAARIQLIETVIKPALSRGTWVIGDRHNLSSQAYQCGGRGVDKKIINSIYENFIGEFSPDITLYLDLPPSIGLKRIRKRGIIDRIEKEKLFFFECTREYYLLLAAKDESIFTIDATKPLKIVTDRIHKLIKNWILQKDKIY